MKYGSEKDFFSADDLSPGLDEEVMVKGATGIVEHGETWTLDALGSVELLWSQLAGCVDGKMLG